MNGFATMGILEPSQPVMGILRAQESKADFAAREALVRDAALASFLSLIPKFAPNHLKYARFQAPGFKQKKEKYLRQDLTLDKLRALPSMCVYASLPT
jgi:hypothetical protein